MANSSPGNYKWHEKISTNFINNIEYLFNRLGQSIARHPIRTIIISIIFVIICSFGFFRFHQEKNFIKLWVPSESEFMKNTEWLMDTFKRAPRPEEIILEADDVLVPEVLIELNKLNEQIVNIETEENIKWEDICFKVLMVSPTAMKTFTKTNKSSDDGYDPTSYIPSSMYCFVISSFPKGCYQQNILELWNFDTNKIESLTKEEIIHDIITTTISPVSGHPINYTQLLGGIEHDEKGNIISAKSLLSSWLTDIDLTKVNMDKAGNDFGTADWATEDILKWEQKFLEICKNTTENLQNIKVKYFSGRSFSDLSGQAIFNDIPTLIFGVFAMIIYILFAISKLNCIDAKVVLAFCGLFSILLSILVACSICSLFGVFYGPVHTALPFLMMGLAVDDMFVVAASWDYITYQQKKAPLPERIGLMLQHAGVSISVTSITDFMAFLVGSFTIIPSLKSFCIYAAMGVLATFIFVVTFFVACFTLDQKRVELNRNGIIPFIKHRPYEKNACSKKNYGKNIFSFIYDKIILSIPGKIIVILFTLGITAFSIDRTLRLQQRFDPLWFIPENSYMSTYVKSKVMFYPTFGYDGMMLMGKLNYTEEYPKIRALDRELENRTDVLHTTISWVAPFYRYMKRNHDKDLDVITLSDDDWSFYLSKFLFSPGGGIYQQNFKFKTDLECGTPASEILAATINFDFQIYDKPELYIKSMRTVYDISKHVNFTTGDRFVTPWSKMFVTWLTDEVIDIELTRNLLLALACVMFCTMVLIANLQICFWIFICVLLCMINVCGFMQVWGLTIDIISCICLTLGIGLCVDYAAHIGYTFITVDGESRTERALLTVNTIGTAVLHGGLSTLIAVFSLFLTDCYTFQAFFKIFLLVVIFGQFFGIVLLPVILSLIGPKSRKTHQIVQQTELQ